MEWTEWAPTYRAILADMGYEEGRDVGAARVLQGLLPPLRLAGDAALAARLQGRIVVVVGTALKARAPLPQGEVLVACDGATSLLLSRGIVPDLVVTDLDGNPEDQARANAAGAIAVVHAHGDNVDAVQGWLPRFRGALVGTCQCEPPGGAVRNFGGFTDGDRACLLAAHFGAAGIRLAGFDLAAPVPKAGRDREVKRRKLAWAQRILEAMDPAPTGLAPQATTRRDAPPPGYG